MFSIHDTEAKVDVTVALRTSIGLVLNTFDESIASFKFPPKVAAKLQGFVDYR